MKRSDAIRRVSERLANVGCISSAATKNATTLQRVKVKRGNRVRSLQRLLKRIPEGDVGREALDAEIRWASVEIDILEELRCITNAQETTINEFVSDVLESLGGLLAENRLQSYKNVLPALSAHSLLGIPAPTKRGAAASRRKGDGAE